MAVRAFLIKVFMADFADTFRRWFFRDLTTSFLTDLIFGTDPHLLLNRGSIPYDRLRMQPDRQFNLPRRATSPRRHDPTSAVHSGAPIPGRTCEPSSRILVQWSFCPTRPLRLHEFETCGLRSGERRM